jgi:hypothetical protein
MWWDYVYFIQQQCAIKLLITSTASLFLLESGKNIEKDRISKNNVNNLE